MNKITDYNFELQTPCQQFKFQTCYYQGIFFVLSDVLSLDTY